MALYIVMSCTEISKEKEKEMQIEIEILILMSTTYPLH